MNNKIIRRSLSDVVAETLHEQIISGKYQLDQQLPTEPELMEEFGVGRSSVREAIRKLENTGVVRVQQGLGTFVASKNALSEPLSRRLQSASESDIEEVRELLELKIVEKAAINRTKKDIANIKAALERRNKAADQQKLLIWLEEDINFHISIADACKNPILTELYKTFGEQQLKRSISKTYTKTFSMHNLTEWHQTLVDAIVEQDVKKAVKAILAMRGKE